MFDQSMYRNILTAAYTVLKNNINKTGIAFSEEFMTAHDPNNGASSQRNAQNLFDFVAEQARRANGGRYVIANDNQLFDIVTAYIEPIFRDWSVRNSPQQSSFGYNGNSGFSGGGFSGGFSQQRNGFSSSSTPIGAGSHLLDDVDCQMTPQPTSTNSERLSVSPIRQNDNATYVHNPLDELEGKGLSFSVGDVSPNWGLFESKGKSIALMKRAKLKTSSGEFSINICDGFEKTYFNTPLDVVNDFFKVVPDGFLAENFIFRVFYNHIEELPVPTKDFIKLQNEFKEKIAKGPISLAYKAIIDILNNLYHGPRMALAEYLVRHINRALYLSCGIIEDPTLRIKFSQIEDLDELLGTNFKSRLVESSDNRSSISTIVNRAIINAITDFSTIMFTAYEKGFTSVIKASPVFDYSMEGIYLSKSMIPDDTESSEHDFYDRFEDRKLSTTTYIRSVRSVVVTNILGGNALSSLTKDPVMVYGDIPEMFNEYILHHQRNDINSSSVSDLMKRYKGYKLDKALYQTYIGDSGTFEDNEANFYIDTHLPLLPVDQTIFAIQYKVKPTDYIAGIDLHTVMGRNTHKDRTGAILSKRKFETFTYR